MNANVDVFRRFPRRLGGWALGLAVAGALGWWGGSAGGSSIASAPPAVFSAPDSAVAVAPAGPEYARRGPLWRWLWGEHYRRQWAAPVAVPVLRLAQAELRPLRAGGSNQTRTLRLRTPDGREFVLRSVDKDPRPALAPGWRRRCLGPLLQDQTSAAPPYGAYVAAALAQAAGVYHTNPRLVYLLPGHDLRQTLPAFGPGLYLFEERADGDQSHAPSFGRSARVVGSAAMLARVCAGPGAQLAARPYLRARLLDMLVGDWSRRPDQWRWATFPAAAGGEGRGVATEFRPIPRDRDQAFFRFDDGVLTRALSWVLPRYQSFGPRLALRNVEPLTRTARCLDQTALALVPEAVFLAEADSLRRRLPDSVLVHALRTAPPEVQAQLARVLLPALRARRDALPAVARRFFRVLQTDAAVVGTDQAERFVLTALGPGRLRLQAWTQPPTGPARLRGTQLYDVRGTRRLSLYGLGGNDTFEVRGGTWAPGFAVKLYGGAGRNAVRPRNAPGKLGLSVHGPGEAPDTRDAASWVRGNYRLGK